MNQSNIAGHESVVKLAINSGAKYHKPFPSMTVRGITFTFGQLDEFVSKLSAKLKRKADEDDSYIKALQERDFIKKREGLIEAISVAESLFKHGMINKDQMDGIAIAIKLRISEMR